MNWVAYQDIANALSKGAIPKGKIYDSEHSTPDVYGRAIQHFISLQEAQQRGEYAADAVQTWRGLISLLALRNYLDLPLYWTRVDLTEEMRDSKNLFYMALEHPSNRADRVLFPGQPKWQWDGKVFYVLQWAPEGKNPEDVLLYSPYTLVYPVAGWRQKYQKIAKGTNMENRVFARFFDPDETVQKGQKTIPHFRPLVQKDPGGRVIGTVLNSGEPDMLCYYLNELLSVIGVKNAEAVGMAGTNSAQSTVGDHISQFLAELREDCQVVLGSSGAFRMVSFPSARRNAVQVDWIPNVLQQSVQVGEDRYFADQICYFKAEGSPFAGEYDYGTQHLIQNAPNGERWYAFLPIHPDHRHDCVRSGLAASVRMVYMQEPNVSGSERIRATMNLGGKTIGRDYKISEGRSMQKNMAVPLSKRNDTLNLHSWPMLAVWPKKIGVDWNEYYVMLEDGIGCENLEIANTRHLQTRSKDEIHGTGDYDARESREWGGEYVVKKTNDYVVKTNYVPDAIPLVKYSDGASVSVGMVMPQVSRAYSGLRNVSADVAVDFGTSSTRVFATVDDDPIEEIRVTNDENNEPREVIRYKGDDTKEPLICKNFVAPYHPGKETKKTGNKEKAGQQSAKQKDDKKHIEQNDIRSSMERASETLFSVYRRSKGENLAEVLPMLDGNIYQPTPDERVNDNKHLVSNLKWDMGKKGKYYIAFMKQLLLHITVALNSRGVRQIHWRYSLPRSMSEQNIKEMTRIWTQEMKGYLDEISGDTITHQIEDHAVSESVAASQFFLAKYPEMVHEGKGFLVVDVGGGSTDAALWQMRNGKLTMVWQDSVKVAGQRMCTQWVEQYIEDFKNSIMKTGASEEIKEQFPKLVNILPSQDETAWQEVRETLVDRLLTFYSDDMLISFKEACGETGNRWGMALYERISQGISLMMFCLGFQVGALYVNGRFTPFSDPGYFTIAFGGRGSGMLDWLERIDTLPYGESESTLVRFFNRGLVVGQGAVRVFLEPKERTDSAMAKEDMLSGDDLSVRVIRNKKDPKCEVAYGLLESGAGGEPDDSKDTVRKPGLPSRYYEGAAQTFRELYLKVFPRSDNSSSSSQIVNIPEMDMNKLSSLARKALPAYGADINDAFRVLMEVIYTYLEKERGVSDSTMQQKGGKR